MEAYVIRGILSNKRDDGTISTMLYIESDYEEYQSSKALRAEGRKCDSEWTTLDCSMLHVNDIVELYYGKGFQGKARLSGFRVVKSATPAVAGK